jgi:glycolate oxidase iron-sulfur subunit
MILERISSAIIREALEEINRCTSCGLCKDVCPVFALSKREAESPRGKVNLLRELLTDGMRPASEAVDIFNRCLLCYACRDACPAGVRTERLWIIGREMLADQVGRPLAKQVFLRRILPYPGRYEKLVGLGRKFPGDEDTIRWQKHLLPRPAARRLDRLLSEILEPYGKTVGTVAFFPGCLLTDVFPDMGLKAAEILAFLGYRVITPSERSCCGAPAFNNGDFETAGKLAQANLEMFSGMDVEAIVSPDATCGGAFHHEYDLLFPPESQRRQLYLQVKEKVRDFGEFVLQGIKARKDWEFKPVHRLVTVHDSCHLSHLQHKADIPRRILDGIPGLKLVESERNELCCGFGGSYSVLFPDESKRIAYRKLQYLQHSHSQVIAVGSPGCLWRLRSAAAESALNVQVVHYLEILREAIPLSASVNESSAGQQVLFDSGGI